MVGDRSAVTANAFTQDLATRLANRVQLTTDGHRPYLEVVENAFGVNIDYAMLVKMYGSAVQQVIRIQWTGDDLGAASQGGC